MPDERRDGLPCPPSGMTDPPGRSVREVVPSLEPPHAFGSTLALMTHERARREAGTPTPAAPAVAVHSIHRQPASSLLGLQRLAGNRAVTELVVQRGKGLNLPPRSKQPSHFSLAKPMKPRRAGIVRKPIGDLKTNALRATTFKVDLGLEEAKPVPWASQGPTIATATAMPGQVHSFVAKVYRVDVIASAGGNFRKSMTVIISDNIVTKAMRSRERLLADTHLGKVSLLGAGRGQGDSANPFGRFRYAPVVIFLPPLSPLAMAPKKERQEVRQHIKERLDVLGAAAGKTVVTKKKTKTTGLHPLYAAPDYEVFGSASLAKEARQIGGAALPVFNQILPNSQVLHNVAAMSNGNPTNPRTKTVNAATLRMHRGSERSNLGPVMGASANDVAAALNLAKTNYEWLHLVAHRFGGEDAPSNLVLGSYDANTRMIEWEELVTNAVTRGAKALLSVSRMGGPAPWLSPSLKARAEITLPSGKIITVEQTFETLRIEPVVQAALAVARRSGALAS
ncbi:MAG: hypothetical protein QOF60_1053 [Actinomycetota bacterium]|nr:hypothetical protein [Actinomycetota bacterium]